MTTRASSRWTGRLTAQPPGIIPSKVIRRGAAPLLKALLSAPLCYTAGGAPAGTLKSLSRWCAGRRGDVRLHFAKTGTQVTADPNATVDVWTTGWHPVRERSRLFVRRADRHRLGERALGHEPPRRPGRRAARRRAARRPGRSRQGEPDAVTAAAETRAAPRRQGSVPDDSRQPPREPN